MLNASFVHLDFVVLCHAILWCLLGVGQRSCHCAEAMGHPLFSDKHLSLHHFRNVRSVLFEILLGCGKDLLFVTLTSSIFCFQAERIHHDLLGFSVGFSRSSELSESLLLSYLDAFLCSTNSSSKSVFGTVTIPKV